MRRTACVVFKQPRTLIIKSYQTVRPIIILILIIRIIIDYNSIKAPTTAWIFDTSSMSRLSHAHTDECKVY